MSVSADRLARARSVADAVLYEGYLLYPYRASSDKNRTRWQFGVLGPPGAADRGLGEAESMTTQILLAGVDDASSLLVHLRFLQLQHRQVYDTRGAEVAMLIVADDGVERAQLTWDEAVELEVDVPLADLARAGATSSVHEVDGFEEAEVLAGGGSVVRRRWPLSAAVRAETQRHGTYTRLTLRVANTHAVRPSTREEATRTSLLGAHLLVEAEACSFVSVIDPPPAAQRLAEGCRQNRCWPVLAGEPGENDLLLGSPIILYDHPEVAPESAGALFDATEIDEILTLRVMTMSDAEKAEARATDPRAAAIIDRCDAMTADELQRLHGIFRDPRGPATPWWETDASVDPGTDAVVVNGVPVRKGSLVRVRPSRRADAQDLFFADRIARVTAVLSDVDGGTHVAVVLEDDPAGDLHDWYGRYLYFAPDEVEPLDPADSTRGAQPHQEQGGLA